ncbi:MFS transporter [Actinoalloteichus spitiensis]|uniref:MFS transporter n=1 Tax=Actinoalloteichus spitiensis TaxID=252394 RepID=UPI000373600A|nr:MFS transporter [Actinoalloteichus spitiensis]
MTPNSALAPLSSRPFRNYFVGRSVLLLGEAIAPVALTFAVLDLTGSTGDVGLVLAGRSIPLLLFLLVGGVVADRLPRHLVLLAGCLVSALTQGAAAALVITGTGEVGQLVAIEAVNGIAAAFALPATNGMVPQLLPSTLWQRANALVGFSRGGITVIGASGGGALVAVLGPGWVLAFDAGCMLLAALFFALMRLPKRVSERGGRIVADLRQGWTEFASRPWLWQVVSAFSLVHAVTAGAWLTLGASIADDTVGRAWWGATLGAQAAGVVVGTVVMLYWGPRRPLATGLLLHLTFVPMYLAVVVAPHPAVLLPAAVLAGVGGGIFIVCWETSLQRNVPSDVLSRVISYDMLVSRAAVPVGQLAGGYLALRFGEAPVLLVGTVLAGGAVLSLLASRSVRGLGTDPAAGVALEPALSPVGTDRPAPTRAGSGT